MLQSRRAAIGMLAGVAALAGVSAPSQAAFGDAANVFGKITNKSGVQMDSAEAGSGIFYKMLQSKTCQVNREMHVFLCLCCSWVASVSWHLLAQ